MSNKTVSKPRRVLQPSANGNAARSETLAAINEMSTPKPVVDELRKQQAMSAVDDLLGTKPTGATPIAKLPQVDDAVSSSVIEHYANDGIDDLDMDMLSEPAGLNPPEVDEGTDYSETTELPSELLAGLRASAETLGVQEHQNAEEALAEMEPEPPVIAGQFSEETDPIVESEGEIAVVETEEYVIEEIWPDRRDARDSAGELVGASIPVIQELPETGPVAAQEPHETTQVEAPVVEETVPEPAPVRVRRSFFGTTRRRFQEGTEQLDRSTSKVNQTVARVTRRYFEHRQGIAGSAVMKKVDRTLEMTFGGVAVLVVGAGVITRLVVADTVSTLGALAMTASQETFDLLGAMRQVDQQRQDVQS